MVSPDQDSLDGKIKEVEEEEGQSSVTDSSNIRKSKSVGGSSSRAQRIKRPMNAFMVWSSVERKRLAEKEPNMHNTELSKRLGEIWKSMTDDMKQPFRNQAQKLKEKLMTDHPEYKYRPRRRRDSRQLQHSNLFCPSGNKQVHQLPSSHNACSYQHNIKGSRYQPYEYHRLSHPALPSGMDNHILSGHSSNSFSRDTTFHYATATINNLEANNNSTVEYTLPDGVNTVRYDRSTASSIPLDYQLVIYHNDKDDNSELPANDVAYNPPLMETPPCSPYISTSTPPQMLPLIDQAICSPRVASQLSQSSTSSDNNPSPISCEPPPPLTYSHWPTPHYSPPSLPNPPQTYLYHAPFTMPMQSIYDGYHLPIKTETAEYNPNIGGSPSSNGAGYHLHHHPSLDTSHVIMNCSIPTPELTPGYMSTSCTEEVNSFF